MLPSFIPKPKLKRGSKRVNNAAATRMQPRWQQNSLSGMRTRHGTAVRANPGEYRRKKFSQQRREEYVHTALGYTRIAGVAALLGVLVALSWVSDVTVASTNSSQTDLQAIKSTADEYLSGGFMRRSKLFMNQSELAKTVQEKHPSLEQVTVDSSLFGRSITVAVSPKQAIFRFSSQQAIKDSDTLWLSQDGILVSAATGVNEAITIADRSDIDYQLGDQVVAPTQITYVSNVARKLTGEGFVLASVELTDAPKHLRLFLKEKPFYILISTDRNSDTVVTDIKKVLAYVEKNGVGVREYIDVRVEDKAFYK